ncbi:MAG: RNA polymerase sigma factor [Myxococcales bacterium]|nr:MAG: RNA polymerase sigma factor [Myxococcales bacterium]
MRTLVGLEEAKDVLVARCVAGDESAWASLYARHARTIAHFLRRLGVPQDALDDALQEVFLQAFRSLDRFRGEAAIRTWLYRLAVTQARRSREKARFARRIRQLLALEVASDTELYEGHAGQAERLLQSALERLTALEREAFVLYELEGQSGAELAAIFGCPEATVYRRLHDARKKFQSFIETEARA